MGGQYQSSAGLNKDEGAALPRIKALLFFYDNIVGVINDSAHLNNPQIQS